MAPGEQPSAVSPPGGRSAAGEGGKSVRLEDLRVGPVLAEGGEGRVHLLPRQPHLLYKAYRHPARRDHLEFLADWPVTLPPGSAARVRAAAAWPAAVVTGEEGRAVGLLVPRAPRRFSVRHRDGHSRLASLSYLTADPAHRAAAYGMELPGPAGPERIGLVYALARLIDAFRSGPAPIGHGDLSTKNVLWSLQRGPEVFVIDCDNAEIFRPEDGPDGAGQRRRAMTPNWDDPAVNKGSNPTLASDLYSLALVFLRVVGAANFPIQARQRAGGPVAVEFPVPTGPGSKALLDPGVPIWGLAARSLSVEDPQARPPASAWVAALEGLLRDMGAPAVIEAVQRCQGGGEPAGSVTLPARNPRDVTIKAVAAPQRPARSWSKVSPSPRYSGAVSGAGTPATPGPGGFVWSPVGPGTPAAWSRRAPTASAPAGAGPGPAAPAPGVVSGVAVWPEVRSLLARAGRWWVRIHLAMLRALTTAGRRRAGMRSLVFCFVVDLALAVMVAIFATMILAPVLGV